MRGGWLCVASHERERPSTESSLAPACAKGAKCEFPMSIQMVEAIKDYDMRSAKKSVLFWMAFRANENDEAWPGPASIGRALCLNERTVRRALKELRADGLLVEVGKGRGGVNRFRVNPVAVPGGQGAPRAQRPPGVNKGDPGRSTLGTPGSLSPTPGTVPPKQEEQNQHHSPTGSAPSGAQASAKKIKWTPEQNATRANEFAQMRAAKGLMTESLRCGVELQTSDEQMCGSQP